MSDIMNQRYLVSYKLNNDTGLYDLTMNDGSLIKNQYRIIWIIYKISKIKKWIS